MKRLNVLVWSIGMCGFIAVNLCGQGRPNANPGKDDMRSTVMRPIEPGSSQSSSPVAGSSQAVIPRLIKFSGAFHDFLGKPLTGTVDVTFSLYSTESGGDALWFETQSVQADELGRYTALLGAMHADGLPVELFTSGEVRWLGIQVGHEPEQQPRVLLVSVPYALKAGDAETLGGKPASAYMLADTQDGTNSVTTSSSTTGDKTGTSASGKNKGTRTANTSVLTACSSVTSDGTAVASSIAMFTTNCNIESSAIYQANGNIGIGTSTPVSKVDILNGNIRLVEGGSYPAFIEQTPGSIFTITNGVGKKLAFDYNGNLGLGTLAPAALLDVENGNIRLARGGSYPAIIDQSLGSIFTITNGVGKKLAFDYNGNLGIGTTTPAKPVDIASAGGILMDRVENSSTQNEIFFADNGQIRSKDDYHRIIFDRTSNVMEMREYGTLVFSPGATASTRTQKVTFTSSGNVGIGTSSPSNTLHTVSSSSALARFQNNGTGSDHSAIVDIYGGDGNLWRLGVGGSGNGLGFTGGDFYVEEYGSGEAFRIDTSHNIFFDGANGIVDNGGKWGLGCTFRQSGYTLTVCGGGSSEGAIAYSWDTFSSRRFKTNIHTLRGGLSKVEHMRGVTYNDKSNGKAEVGVIAEEVAQVVPQVVGHDKEGEVVGLDYSRLTAVLIQAVKEQQAQIRNLKSQVRQLKQQQVALTALENRLNRLEASARDQQNASAGQLRGSKGQKAVEISLLNR